MEPLSKYTDPTKNFINHGVKESGGDTYILLIDMSGVTIIKKVNSTYEDIRFTKKTSGTIADFWSDPTVHTYVYYYQL